MALGCLGRGWLGWGVGAVSGGLPVVLPQQVPEGGWQRPCCEQGSGWALPACRGNRGAVLLWERGTAGEHPPQQLLRARVFPFRPQVAVERQGWCWQCCLGLFHFLAALELAVFVVAGPVCCRQGYSAFLGQSSAGPTGTGALAPSHHWNFFFVDLRFGVFFFLFFPFDHNSGRTPISAWHSEVFLSLRMQYGQNH